VPIIEDLAQPSIKKYQQLIARLDKTCRAIQEDYADQIACQKGCAGNCCRIHLSVFPIEAVSLARALKKLPREMAPYIRDKARTTDNFSPCPLLEDGACLMYASRLVICRTHGLPMRSEYRGHRSIGFCQKNFQNLKPIPDEAVIDLNKLNAELAAANRTFVDTYLGRVELPTRFTIGEALLLEEYEYY
jgi:Fe-S-cluster containining protein